MNLTRRQFIVQGSALTLVAGCAAQPKSLVAQKSPVIALVEGPEVERYRQAQQRVLAKYAVRAHSRFVRLRKPVLRAHVLDAGQGEPLVLIHGGAAVAVQFAPLLSRLQGTFHCLAPDRPGCGLTDKIDYAGLPFRQHAVDCVRSLLDELQLPKAAIAGNSMGGYWALVFALAAPERVTKLVLLGGVAGSGPPQPGNPGLPDAPEPSLENARGLYRALMANGDRASSELVDVEYASKSLPGASLGWNSMLEQIRREGGTPITYALRPELKNLTPPALFIWGDKDIEGPPSLAREMATMTPRGRCEVVPDAGHLIWLDQPEACARLMIDFLKAA